MRRSTKDVWLPLALTIVSVACLVKVTRRRSKMSCLCTHSIRSHEEGKRCTAIVGDKQCPCPEFRDGDVRAALEEFDRQTELYKLVQEMQPLTKSIQ